MRDDPIYAGAIVRLKSGGPPMTAARADRDGWECLWFAGDELKSAVFVGDTLEPDTGLRGEKPVITPYPPRDDDQI